MASVNTTIDLTLDPQSLALLKACSEILGAERAQLITTVESLAKSLASITATRTPNDLRAAGGAAPIAPAATPSPRQITLVNAEGESVGVAKWSDSLAEWVIFPNADNGELELTVRHYREEAALLLEARQRYEHETENAKLATEAIANATKNLADMTGQRNKAEFQRDRCAEHVLRVAKETDGELSRALQLIDQHGSDGTVARIPLGTLEALRLLLENLKATTGMASLEDADRVIRESGGPVRAAVLSILSRSSCEAFDRKMQAEAEAEVVRLTECGTPVAFAATPELAAELRAVTPTAAELAAHLGIDPARAAEVVKQAEIDRADASFIASGTLKAEPAKRSGF